MSSLESNAAFIALIRRILLFLKSVEEIGEGQLSTLLESHQGKKAKELASELEVFIQ